jgi:thiosulfate dehydrogenase [quinone] large subunit
MSSKSNCCCKIFMGEAWACLILRLWVGMRLFFAGITKWKQPDGQYSAEWMEKKMGAIGDLMKTNTPEIPSWMVDQFTAVLPYALIIIGAAILLGLFSRVFLALGGLLFLGLTFGQNLLPDDTEVVFRGIEVLLTAGALALVRYNIFAIDNLIAFALPNKKKRSDDDDDEDED